MRALLLVVATMSVHAMVVGAEPKLPTVVINNNGSYDRGTFHRKGDWLGLYCKDGGCELRNADVRITSSQKEGIVGMEKTDELMIEGEPLAFFYGMPLKSGPVTTWFIAENQRYQSSHTEKLRKLGRWQMPWGTRPLAISWVKLPENGGFRYHVSDDATKQFVFATSFEGHYGGDNTPFIHWVGDIDGDGMIDFLVSFPDDNCGFDERLYLSSLAGKGELVRKAAQILGRQPACGC